MPIAFRFAGEKDVPLLLEFIRKLAVYEGLDDRMEATEESLRDTLFRRGSGEAIFILADGREVGFAVWYYTFSTFRGQRGLYLEDLFVDGEERGKGYGRSLLARVAAVAAERGCFRMDWSVLDWNEPSIAFYEGLGARPVADWVYYRLAGNAFDALAEEGRGRLQPPSRTM